MTYMYKACTNMKTKYEAHISVYEKECHNLSFSDSERKIIKITFFSKNHFQRERKFQ